MANDMWYCAQCLRLIRDGDVYVRHNNVNSYEQVTPYNLHSYLHSHATGNMTTTKVNKYKRAYHIDSVGTNSRLLLFACTIVNNEYRCAEHLDPT